MWWGIPDTCRDHKCLTTCEKQHRQNEPAGQVDIPSRVEICVIWHPGHVLGPKTCQKQHRQNEPAGQVDVPTWLEVCVTGDPRHLQGPQMSHRLSKTTQTVWTSWLGRHCYWSGGLCDGGSGTHVGTTDVSPPVKNNTDRMNQLFGLTFLMRWRSVWWVILDTCRDHRRLTTCQKQHRQNEAAEMFTGVEMWGIGLSRVDRIQLVG